MFEEVFAEFFSTLVPSTAANNFDKKFCVHVIHHAINRLVYMNIVSFCVQTYRHIRERVRNEQQVFYINVLIITATMCTGVENFICCTLCDNIETPHFSTSVRDGGNINIYSNFLACDIVVCKTRFSSRNSSPVLWLRVKLYLHTIPIS